MSLFRKSFFFLFCSLTIAINAFAQPLGNEWIDYSKTYHKIKIAQDGVYRIPFSTLNNISGLNLSTTRGTDFILYHMGEVVPMYVSTNNFFSQNDFIEFYGKKNDGTLDKQLYADPDKQQPNPYYSLFNDTAVYFLAWQTGNPRNIIGIANDLTNLPAKETSCKQKVLLQQNAFFEPGKPYYLSNKPTHRSIFEDGEGFLGAINLINKNAPYTAAINTPGIINSGTAALRFGITGTSNTQHVTNVKLNNNTIWDTTYFAYSFNLKSFNIPQNNLSATNNVTFTANGPGSVDNNTISYVELIYNRNFNFNANTTALFSINGSLGVKYIEINGFNSQVTSPILYDLTNNARIVGTQANPLQFKLPSAPATADRLLYLFSEAAIITITELEPVSFTNFSSPNRQCNFCIISHPSLFNDGFGNDWVGEYKKYRQTIAGGSWVTQVINIDELYDQFSYGIRKHPLAIRNLSRAAQNNWVTKPEYFFLIGKGRPYEVMRTNQSNPNGPYASCLIPTFGAKPSDNTTLGSGGSDNLLLAENVNSIMPLCPVGRLSALTGEHVRIYFDKIKEFEEAQNKKGDPYQTIANKLWMKNILHMGGGTSAGEQVRFANYLEIFSSIVACELFGPNIKTYLKTSIDPIQIGLADDIKNRVDGGVSLITFFGHSSTNTFDISVDEPKNWTNSKKYPLIVSNGCFTGNIFSGGLGISEEFVLAEKKGAIGFLSTTSLSSATGLFNYSNTFYRNFGITNYNEPIGKIMQRTIQDIQQNSPNDNYSLMIAEEMTLNGDPSIKLNTHEKPDYVLEPQMISFIPSIVNIEDATFTMRVVMPNLGKAIKDSVVLAIDRVFPGGSSVRYERKVPAPCYVDTIDVVINTGESEAFGLNNFIIKIEDEDRINELSETNNQIGASLNILSDDIFPIYPYEFAIVNTDSLTLAASTANTFAAQRTYSIEIDTTELFNSPYKRSQTFTMTGGLLKWKLPFSLSALPDSTVYYWRVGLDSSVHSGSRGYNYSSFVYLPNDSAGWNQSHYYQWQKDEYNNMFLANDRTFKFIGDTKQVSVYTGKCLGSGITVGDCQRISYSLNGGLRERLVCGGQGYRSGLTVAVFDPVTGEPWKSKWSDVVVDPCSGNLINQIHKNVHCNPGTARDFDAFNFPVNSVVGSCPNIWQQRFIDFLNSIPNDHYILIYSTSVSADINYSTLTPALINTVSGLGSQAISQLIGYVPNTPWAFFCQKGNSNFPASEQIGTITEPLQFNATFNVSWYKGSFKSTLIGPAFKWKDLFWESFPFDTPDYDSSSVSIIGVKNDLTEEVLFNNITATSFNLSSVDAVTYPYLRLRYNTADDSLRTPAQLNYWKVVHDIVPEAALAPNIYLQYDTAVALGENLKLNVAIENVTPVSMDSLLVKYSIISSGNQASVTYARYDSLRAFQSYNLNYLFNTNCNCLSDINTIIIEANPDKDQREQFHFNNIGILNFNVNGDNKNPLLDVTFDGAHIINGDIVSSEPDILIKLKDENKYLALDDTSLIKVFIKYPDGTIEPQHFSETYMTFTPATPSQLARKNEAQINLRKRFTQDGKYELQVQARDKSRNISGTYGDPVVGIDYRIGFEVINKEMITNVVNYPNPFSTATKFVFTLTGAEIPSYMKIQIMTISGKIVREIEMSELGPIRIGRNITEFTWDGTDQYGDRLANGLYFYRVVASKNGKQLEKLETSADKYFKSGLGKMYMIK